ncbi:hypothetical protein [Sinorhizobium medicae]
MLTIANGPIGMLSLDEPACPSPPRTWGEDPHEFAVGLVKKTVVGVSVPDIIYERDHVRGAFIEAARALAAQGCSAITSNCGYSVLYQKDVIEATRLPTVLSSLLLLPAVVAALPPDYQVGIICYDSTCLSDEHLKASWPQAQRSRLNIVGIEGTEAWSKSNSSDAVYEWPLFAKAIENCVEVLMRAERPTGAVIVECCAFGSFVPMIKARMGVPTCDIYDAAKLLLGDAASGIIKI